MIAPLQKANDAGLPLLTVDTFIGDGNYTDGPVTFPLSFIASDNRLGGEIACKALVEAGRAGGLHPERQARHLLHRCPRLKAASSSGQLPDDPGGRGLHDDDPSKACPGGSWRRIPDLRHLRTTPLPSAGQLWPIILSGKSRSLLDATRLRSEMSKAHRRSGHCSAGDNYLAVEWLLRTWMASPVSPSTSPPAISDHPHNMTIRPQQLSHC
jgi:hypothetical protein